MSICALMMKTTLTFVALFCACALTSFGEEKTSQERLTQLFKNFDTNGDGGVTLDEYKAGMVGQMAPERVATVFKTKDRNKDGKLTLQELVDPMPEEPAKKDDAKKAGTKTDTKAPAKK